MLLELELELEERSQQTLTCSHDTNSLCYNCATLKKCFKKLRTGKYCIFWSSLPSHVVNIHALIEWNQLPVWLGSHLQLNDINCICFATPCSFYGRLKSFAINQLLHVFPTGKFICLKWPWICKFAFYLKWLLLYAMHGIKISGLWLLCFTEKQYLPIWMLMLWILGF